jgi:hypothetical protein
MSTAIPVNPNYANNVNESGSADSSLVESVTGGGFGYFVPTESPLVSSNSHPIASRADGALWDITSGTYVSIQNSNCGTTNFPKNGQ